jgi:hypothetical protein
MIRAARIKIEITRLLSAIPGLARIFCPKHPDNSFANRLPHCLDYALSGATPPNVSASHILSGAILSRPLDRV